uniref:Uncharacterized protein n=1 Tax=Picea glauca TaxID=3330 RepID=A0A101LY03_PICGL|nr:hypothetical protein ABT39_MTgene5616 [Picea glauca]
MRRCLCLGRHYDQSYLAYLLLPLPTASLLTFSFISNGDYSLSLYYSRIYTPPFCVGWERQALGFITLFLLLFHPFYQLGACPKPDAYFILGFH